MTFDHNLYLARTLADLLDTAFRLYRRHVALLCAATGRVLVIAVAIHLLLTNLLGLWLAFLIVIPLSMGITLGALLLLIVHTADADSYFLSSSNNAQLTFRHYLSIIAASIVQQFFLLLPLALWYGGVLLLDEIHKNDPPAYASADTPQERNFACLTMFCITLYPVLAVFVVSICRFVVPAIVLERVGLLRGLVWSWALTTTAWRQSLLTTLLILITQFITQLPLLTLWMILPGSHHMPGEMLGQFVMSVFFFTGVMFALPLEALVSILMFEELRLRRGYTAHADDALASNRL
jgi:hypothetical protein